MVYQVGKYNVDVLDDVYYDKNKTYKSVIISLFNGDKEVERKRFYFLYQGEFGVPNLKDELFVDILFGRYKNNERFIFEENMK